jgi:hypothetical protein
MRQRCLVVVKVGHRLERSEEVGDGVGSVLGKDFILGVGEVLIWQSVEEGDQEEIIDLDGAGTFRIEHSGHLDALVEELVFELIEGAGPRAGEERDHSALCNAEAAGARVELQADKVEVVRGGVVAGRDVARIGAKKDVGFF